ncbi:MAG: DinB family protein, partial [Dehalococcoidia bacterium]
LASIDPLLVSIVRGFQSGNDTARDSAGRAFSIDEWNEERILERRERTTEELLSELDAHRPALNEAIADFTDEQLDHTFHFGGDKSRAPRDVKVGDFLNGLVYHDRWHMEDAKRALEGRGEQPFGDAAWASAMRAREQRRG